MTVIKYVSMKSHSITVFNSQYSIVILNRHQIKPFFQVEIGNKKLKEKTLYLRDSCREKDSNGEGNDGVDDFDRAQKR